MAAYTATGAEVPHAVKEALQDAMELALANVPVFEGRVVVCPDVSGSMSGTKIADAPKLNDSVPALAGDKTEISTAKKVGLWVGGNKNGLIGFTGEFIYLTRKLEDPFGSVLKTTALEIPAVFHINVGSRSRNAVWAASYS